MMWPFNTIAMLKSELDNSRFVIAEQDKTLNTLRKEIDSLKETVTIAENTLRLLNSDLQKAKRNDTPHDLRTGKFTKVK